MMEMVWNISEKKQVPHTEVSKTVVTVYVCLSSLQNGAGRGENLSKKPVCQIHLLCK